MSRLSLEESFDPEESTGGVGGAGASKEGSEIVRQNLRQRSLSENTSLADSRFLSPGLANVQNIILLRV